MTAPDKDRREPRCDEVIAGEYVLGALSAEDRRKVELRLARDRQFAAMVSRWERNLSAFGEDGETIASSPGMSAAMDRRPFDRPVCDAAMVGTVSGGLWSSLSFWRALALASIAVAAGVAWSGRGTSAPQAAGGQFLAELSGEAAGLGLVVRFDEIAGVLRVAPVAAGGETGGTLELWLAEDGRAPVSLGTLPQGGEGVVALPAERRSRLAAGAVLSVSLEPAGGSPTGRMTGPLVASGAIHAD